jgi:hypothetical protein
MGGLWTLTDVSIELKGLRECSATFLSSMERVDPQGEIEERM